VAADLCPAPAQPPPAVAVPLPFLKICPLLIGKQPQPGNVAALLLRMKKRARR